MEHVPAVGSKWAWENRWFGKVWLDGPGGTFNITNLNVGRENSPDMKGVIEIQNLKPGKYRAYADRGEKSHDKGETHFLFEARIKAGTTTDAGTHWLGGK